MLYTVTNPVCLMFRTRGGDPVYVTAFKHTSYNREVTPPSVQAPFAAQETGVLHNRGSQPLGTASLFFQCLFYVLIRLSSYRFSPCMKPDMKTTAEMEHTIMTVNILS